VESPRRKIRILVCRGPTCGDQRDSAAIHAELSRVVRERKLEDLVILDWQSCFGQCQKGPNVLFRETAGVEDKLSIAVMPLASGRRSAMHHGVSAAKIERILDMHLRNWGLVGAIITPQNV
jgi:(2Fe-2S) ferredoxin